MFDQQGAALPGVTVTVTNQANGNFRDALSGTDGAWIVSGITPGTYQVAAQLESFKKFVQREVRKPMVQ